MQIKSSTPRVVRFNLTRRIAWIVGEDGLEYEAPITNLFDELGDETDDDSAAKRFVAGSGDVWIADWIENFELLHLN